MNKEGVFLLLMVSLVLLLFKGRGRVMNFHEIKKKKERKKERKEEEDDDDEEEEEIKRCVDVLDDIHESICFFLS
jgi:hypothetical protein